MAKTKGIRALEVEKLRKEAEEKQRRELQVGSSTSSQHSYLTCM